MKNVKLFMFVNSSGRFRGVMEIIKRGKNRERDIYIKWGGEEVNEWVVILVKIYVKYRRML